MIDEVEDALRLFEGVIDEVEDALRLFEGVIDDVGDDVRLFDDVVDAVCVMVGESEPDGATDCDTDKVLTGEREIVELGLIEGEGGATTSYETAIIGLPRVSTMSIGLTNASVILDPCVTPTD